MPESAEMVLVQFDGTGTNNCDAITPALWAAASFKPDFDALAPGQTVTEWKITGIEVRAGKSASSPPGPTDYVLYTVRKTDAARKPDMTAAGKIEAQQLLSAPLTQVTQTDLPPQAGPIPYSNCAGLDPAKWYCVVASQQTFQGGHQWLSHQNNVSPLPPDVLYWHSGNAGNSWEAIGGQKQLYFKILGTFTT